MLATETICDQTRSQDQIDFKVVEGICAQKAFLSTSLVDFTAVW